MSDSRPIYSGCIGIDLGTTFSCVGVWENDHVTIIPNDLGNRTTPSWVAFSGNDRLVGELARQQASANTQRTLYDVKRVIGKQFSDPIIQDDLPHYGFKIAPDNQDRPMIHVPLDDGTVKKFLPEEISSMILTKMKVTAEDYLGKKVVNAVITVPAYFNDAQRTATKNAGQIAGLNVLRIINEPTAAALSYGLHKKGLSNVLIYDLGGGTLDVSLLELNNGIFEVKATRGNTHLGGEDFDNRLTTYLRTLFEKQYKRKIDDNNAKALRKLKDVAEITKNRLSQSQSVRVDIDGFEGVDFHCQVTRNMFETLCMDLFKACLEPLDQVLKDAELEKKDVTEVVLVGGATRIPKVQEILTAYFNGKQLNKSVNPDEAVAYGAAVQGAILTNSDTSGTTKALLLVDVIPLSLGIETSGGIMATIIPRNSTIPCEKSSMFSTVEDNQSIVLVQVYEGERKFTKDNHLLGTFELGGIPKAIRGVPKIEVTFKMDANGILCVTAFEKESQATQTVTITKESGRLSEDEIQKMIEDADKYKAADEIKKDMIECRNSFEKYLNVSQTTINDSEYESALTVDERSWVNQLILSTFDWLNAIDPNTNEPCNRTKEEIIDCKNSVEHHIKPLINKVYARQLATKVKEEEKSPTSAQQINELLTGFDTPAHAPAQQQPAPTQVKAPLKLKLKSKK